MKVGCLLHPTNSRWREALAQRFALAARPAVSVGFSTTPSDDASLGTPVAKNIALNSILPRKANCCLAHLQKKRPGKFRVFVFGGGENRTLVLSKLHIDDYMLSASS